MKTLFFFLLMTLSAHAVGVDPGKLPDPAQEARAQDIMKQLRCLVCQNQSIVDSDADLARDLRAIVRERVTAGDDDGQIREFMTSRYGDWVLLKPPFEGAVILLWLSPLILLVLGGIVIFRFQKAGDVTEAVERGGEKLGRPLPRAALAVIGGVLGAGAVLFYLDLGTPLMPDFPLAEKEQAPQQLEAAKVIDKIKARLLENDREKIGWVALGHYQGQLGQSGAAAMAFERAHALDPENYNILLMYAESLVVLGNGQVGPAALLALKRARALDPAHAGARYYLALADYQAGRVEEAYAAWKMIELRTSDKDPWRGQLRAWIKKAEVEMGLTKPEPVAPAITAEQAETIQKMTPGQQQQLIGEMVARLGGKLEKNPDNVEGWIRLGRAYMVLGQREKAQAALGQAAKYAPDKLKAVIEKELEKIKKSAILAK